MTKQDKETQQMIFTFGVEVPGTRLTPLRLDPLRFKKYRVRYYWFRCRCGTIKSIRGKNVRIEKGGTKSCGCLNRENCRNLKGRHAFEKGNRPWNTGIPGTGGGMKGKISPLRGTIKVTIGDRIFRCKVSDEILGGMSSWYRRYKKTKQWPNCWEVQKKKYCLLPRGHKCDHEWTDEDKVMDLI